MVYHFQPNFRAQASSLNAKIKSFYFYVKITFSSSYPNNTPALLPEWRTIDYSEHDGQDLD